MSLAQIIAALTAFLALPFIPKAVDAIKGVVTDRGRQKLSEIERANLRADKAEAARDKAIAEREEERSDCEREKALLREQLSEARLELQRMSAAAESNLAERDHARDEVELATRFVDAMLDRKK